MADQQDLRLTWQRGIAIIEPAPGVEELSDLAIESAAQMILAPLREQPPTDVIVDLSDVSYVGSPFLTFLLQCHRIVRPNQSELVLAGCNQNIKEVLHIMNFDTLWAIYDSRAEALDALA